MSLRVLHCPTTVGGNPQGICNAERDLGIQSHTVAFTQTAFDYPCDEVLWDATTPPSKRHLLRWSLFLRAWRDFDVIHYNFGTPLLQWSLEDPNNLSMLQRFSPALRCRQLLGALERHLFRKKVVAVTFQGDDARQGDRSLQELEICIAREVGSDYYNEKSDRDKRRSIERFSGYADLIYALNPDLLRVLPDKAKFLPYAHINLRDWALLDHPRSVKPLVLHAPSHRGGKGTRYIIEAVNRLQSEGVQFEFRIIENLTNAEARREYSKADLVIDQLLAGWYGGLAVEAMALGKPVVCYLREEDYRFIPEQMRRDLPLINATPGSIYQVLLSWLTENRGNLAEKGIASRRYVEQWHCPTRIARRLIDDYTRVLGSKKRGA